MEDAEKLCTSTRKKRTVFVRTTENAEAAHKCGIAPGKYESYLTMQGLDETVTAEDVQSMSMREIRQWIYHHSQDGEKAVEEIIATESNEDCESDTDVLEQNNGHHGHGAGNGNGHHGEN